MPTCREIIKLSQGNIDALAEFCGDTSFGNKYIVYELLASLHTKELKSEKGKSSKILATRWNRDFCRIFEQIMKKSFLKLTGDKVYSA